MASRDFTITLGPHTITVEFCPLHDGGSSGLALYDELTIKLDENLEGPKLREIFLHEIFHMISYAHAFDPTEQAVRAYGLGFAQALAAFVDLSEIEPRPANDLSSPPPPHPC